MNSKIDRENQTQILNKPQNSEVYLILDNIRSIFNVGAIFRTADAARVKKIYLCGITAYPSNKDIKLYDKKEIENQIEIIDGKAKINYVPSVECIRNSLESRIAKTALKALGKVEFEYKRTTEEAIEEAKNNNISVVALEQDEGSIDYRIFNYNKPLAIIVGNEVDGVSKEVLNLSDAIIEIPIFGHVDSLNVATATGIILFKAIEQEPE